MARQAHPKADRPAESAGDSDRPGAALVAVRRLFASETPNYFLLLGTTLFLVVFGLVMVLSSSSVESHLAEDSFFAAFIKQGLFALLAIPLMLLASRMPIAFWKRIAFPAMIFGAILQILVFTPLGFGYGGNRNWIDFGFVQAQPAEFVKLALIVWIAHHLTNPKREYLHPRQTIVPITLAAVSSIGFVLIGNDLGTAIVMLSVVAGCLFYGGVKLRYLLLGGGAIAFFGIIFAFASESRSKRINAWLLGCTEEQYYDFCWQPTHGTWALASGGIFGTGLGNSKAKWSWLPEADNDYIFAIVGEELGLIGAIVVLLIFILLAIAFVRVIRMNTDPFARIVTSGVMVWVIGQAFINIAVVLGLLPVLGVPLPLISAGGSALLATLLAIGVVLSFAREQRDPALLPTGPTPAERSRLAAAERSRRRV